MRIDYAQDECVSSGSQSTGIAQVPAQIFDPVAPRKATNVTVNADLLRQARALKLNLSKLLEERLVNEVRSRMAAEWKERNQRAIADYNKRIAAQGVFSDGLRRF